MRLDNQRNDHCRPVIAVVARGLFFFSNVYLPIERPSNSKNRQGETKLPATIPLSLLDDFSRPHVCLSLYK